MPIENPKINLPTTVLHVFHPLGGTPAGARACVSSPFRGRLIEAGFTPVNSNLTSETRLSLAVANFNASPLASTFVQQITSTLGTFSSTGTFEGATCSVVPATNVFINPGDVIQFTTSGGQSSTVALNCYAVILRG